MGKVQTTDYGGPQAPAFTPELLSGADATVITVAECRSGVKVQDRLAYGIVSEEYPDHIWWANKTSLDRIIERLGDDDDEWIGEAIPLVKVRTQDPSRGGATVVKYWAAGEDDWDDILKESGRARTRARRPQAPAKKAAKRKAAKRKKAR